MRSVWFDILLRETIQSGRPLPGHAAKRIPTEFDNPNFSRTSYLEFHNKLAHLEAQDLEERTHFALWLDNRWGGGESIGGSSGVCMSSSFDFRTDATVRDIFIIPGGRFLVTAHDSELRCWDAGFPEVPRSQNKTDRCVSCVGHLLLAKNFEKSCTVPDMSIVNNRPSSSVSMRVAVVSAFAEPSL